MAKVSSYPTVGTPNISDSDFLYIIDNVGGSSSSKKITLGQLGDYVGGNSFSGDYNDLHNKPTIPPPLPSYQQSDTQGLKSRAGNLFWQAINEVPDATTINHILAINGENDQDYHWTSITNILRLSNNGGLAYDGEGKLHTVPSLVATSNTAEENTRAIETLQTKVTQLETSPDHPRFITVEPSNIPKTTAGLRTRFVAILHGVEDGDFVGVSKVQFSLNGLTVGNRVSWNAASGVRVIRSGQMTTSNANSLIRNVSSSDHVELRLSLQNASNTELDDLKFSIYFTS